MPSPVPSSERARIAAIAAAITCVAVVGIGLSLTLPLFSIEMERMGASSTTIGLNVAVAGLATIATVPFVPRLAVRTGVLPLLLGAIAAGAGLLVGFRVLYDLAWWFPLRFLFSASLGVLFVLSEYWITRAAPPDRRGLVMGIYATVLALGFAVGPGLLLLVGTEGWPPYLAGAGLFLLGAVPLLAARALSPEIEAGGAGGGVLRFVVLVPAATLAALLHGAVETGGFAILPLYGLRIGYGGEAAAGLVSLVALGNVLFQVPVGWLADRIDRGRVLLAAAVAGGIGAALIPAASASPPVLSALLFVWGGLTGTLYTVGLAHLGASVRANEQAGANAAFVALYAGGLVVGPPVIGAGMDLAPPQGFAWALAALFAAYVAVVGVRRTARARPSPEGSERGGRQPR